MSRYGTRPNRCPSRNPDGVRCQKDAGHDLPHRSENLRIREWYSDTGDDGRPDWIPADGFCERCGGDRRLEPSWAWNPAENRPCICALLRP